MYLLLYPFLYNPTPNIAITVPAIINAFSLKLIIIYNSIFFNYYN